MRRVLVAAAITCAAVFLISAILFGRSNSGALEEAAAPSAPGARFDPYPAPAMHAQTMEGTQVSLADYRGTPVVVNFFADWCTPCAKEAPELSTLEADYRGQVVMLSIARESSRDGVRDFMRRHDMSWTVLWDGDGRLSEAFRIPGQPATFVLDQQGQVVDAHLGETTAERFSPVLDRLLG